MPRSPAIVTALVLVSACDPAPPEDDAGPGMDAAADAGEPCARDLDCAGTFCRPQRCLPGDPTSDGRGCAPATTPCRAEETCDEASRACVPGACTGEPDADGDGHDSIACGGGDCADDDPTRFPDNGEICDAEGHDEDCLADTVGDRDEDVDGFDSSACCNGDVCGLDCDDALASVRPDVAEVCNGRDDDCDGVMDEEAGAAQADCVRRDRVVSTPGITRSEGAAPSCSSSRWTGRPTCTPRRC